MQQNKMATARMGPLIFSMAMPAIISMLINALYNIVDSIFVARYSQSAIAAVSLVFPLQMLVIALGVGTGVGVGALIARRLGERAHEEANAAGTHGFALAIVGGIVFILVGFGLSSPFLSMYQPEQTTFAQALSYSRIAIGLSIFVIVSMMCEKLQQATGSMVIPMVQGVVGALINVLLDWLLIFGVGPFPELGVLGAAIATIIGQVCGMLIGLWGVFVHQKTLHITLRGFRWNARTVADIYRVGLPSIAMQSMVSIMVAGLNSILIAFSQTAVSVLGVYFKLQTFIFLPVFGLVQGVMPVMSFNYGARNRKRLFSAYRIVLAAALVIMTIGLLLFQTIPQPMLMLFVDKTDAAATADMLAVGVPALKIISLSFLSAGFCIINSTVFQSTARGGASFLVSVVRQLGILPCAKLLGMLLGLHAIWYAFPIAEVFALALSFLLLWQAYTRELRDLEHS